MSPLLYATFTRLPNRITSIHRTPRSLLRFLPLRSAIPPDKADPPCPNPLFAVFLLFLRLSWSFIQSQDFPPKPLSNPSPGYMAWKCSSPTLRPGQPWDSEQLPFVALSFLFSFSSSLPFTLPSAILSLRRLVPPGTKFAPVVRISNP